MIQRQCTLGLDIGDETVVAVVRSEDAGGPDRPPTLLPAHPGRPLRRVGSTVPLYRDGCPVSAADALATMAREAVVRATLAEGALDWTVLTVPPSWGDHRREVLATALRAAGLDHFSLESTAVAVAGHHRRLGALPEGVPVVVVDVGASTVDIAVVRLLDDRVETVAMPPAPLAWGGRDLDDAVVDLVRDCLATEEGTEVDPAELRRASVAAKEALSTDTSTEVTVTRPGGGTCLRLVREDLEHLVAEPLQAVVAAVRRAIAEAGLETAEVGALVLSGGTAAVPLVAETLSAELDRPVVVDGEPAHTAARGAAELAAHRPRAEVVGATQPAGDPAGDPPTPGTVRSAHRRADPGDRPPTRSSTRPPLPPARPRGPRRAARVGVVVASFVAIVGGVAAAASLGPASTPSAPRDQAAAVSAADVAQAGVPDRTTPSDPVVVGLSPAAAEGRAGSSSGSIGGSRAGSSAARNRDGSVPAGAFGTSGSGAGTASTSSSARTTAGQSPVAAGAAVLGSTSSPAPAGSDSAAPSTPVGPSLPPSGAPPAVDPLPSAPPTTSPPTSEPVPSDPPPVVDPGPVPDPAPAPTDPGPAVDPAPVPDPVPEPPAPTEPPPAAPAAAAAA